MKKHIAPEGAEFKYRVTRISTGSITEVAYVTAKDEDEAQEKLFNDELDSDFETIDDDTFNVPTISNVVAGSVLPIPTLLLVASTNSVLVSNTTSPAQVSVVPDNNNCEPLVACKASARTVPLPLLPILNEGFVVPFRLYVTAISAPSL